MDYEMFNKKMKVVHLTTKIIEALDEKYKEVISIMTKHDDLLNSKEDILLSYSVSEALSYYNKEENDNLKFFYANISPKSRKYLNYRKRFIKAYKNDLSKIKDIDKYTYIKNGDVYFVKQEVLNKLNKEDSFFEFLYNKVILDAANRDIRKIVEKVNQEQNENKNNIYKSYFIKTNIDDLRMIKQEIYYWLIILNDLSVELDVYQQIDQTKKKSMFDFIVNGKNNFFINAIRYNVKKTST